MVTRDQLLYQIGQFLEINVAAVVLAEMNLHDLYLDDLLENSMRFDKWLDRILDRFGIDDRPDISDPFLPPHIFPGENHEVTRRRWEDVIRPRLTCGHLADWLLRKMPQISFEPVNIAGRDCAPAGVFFGIASLVHFIVPKADRFPPSCPILGRLQGKSLRRFWAQLRVQTSVPLPELESRLEQLATRVSATCVGLGTLAVLTGCVSAISKLPAELTILFACGWMLSVPATVAVCLASYYLPPY